MPSIRSLTPKMRMLQNIFPAPRNECDGLVISLWVSFGLHLFFLGGMAALICGPGKNLFLVSEKNAAVLEAGPASEKEMKMTLQTAERNSPVSAALVPVPPVEKETTSPKGTKQDQKNSALGAGMAEAFSKLVIGSEHFPAPQYPAEARDLGEKGTVYLRLQFNELGRVADAQIVQSSGHALLDSNARSFILRHWQDARFAGQVITVPVVYALTDNENGP